MKRRRTKRKRRSRTFLDSNFWFLTKRAHTVQRPIFIFCGFFCDCQTIWWVHFTRCFRFYFIFIGNFMQTFVYFGTNIKHRHTHISIPNAIHKWVHTEKEPCESLTNSQQTHTKTIIKTTTHAQQVTKNTHAYIDEYIYIGEAAALLL